MKVKIASNVIVFESAVKAEDIKALQKYDRKALTLYDEEKEPVFAISVAERGSVSNVGLVFGGASRTDGKAVLTVPATDLPKGTEVDAITDKYGAIIDYVNQIEAGIPDALEKVAAKREAIATAITVEL